MLCFGVEFAKRSGAVLGQLACGEGRCRDKRYCVVVVVVSDISAATVVVIIDGDCGVYCYSMCTAAVVVGIELLKTITNGLSHRVIIRQNGGVSRRSCRRRTGDKLTRIKLEIGGQKSGHGDNENEDGTDLRRHELGLHRVPSRSLALTLTTTSTSMRPGND